MPGFALFARVHFKQSPPKNMCVNRKAHVLDESCPPFNFETHQKPPSRPQNLTRHPVRHTNQTSFVVSYPGETIHLPVRLPKKGWLIRSVTKWAARPFHAPKTSAVGEVLTPMCLPKTNPFLVRQQETSHFLLCTFFFHPLYIASKLQQKSDISC